MTVRINKFLADAGIASRRKSEKLILDGEISVNGEIMTDLAYQVKNNDIVKYKNKIVKPVNKKYYLMLNKPIDYACTNSKKHDDKIIFDLIDIDTKLFSIGRLDKDSRGLILITNDGDIYNKIIHPRNEIFKRYIVEIDRDFRKEDKYKLESGIDIGGYITTKSKVKILRNKKIQIEISEGKNRQVRRMFAALGYNVIDLNRISIGKINMSKLEIGKYRHLTNNELNYIKQL
ncbi:pseudouridine synthase [Helcococcus kunzii]|uniref:Pseudouridine synthase n=1 Tax=Helcococcus kunzii ATCC 51366 TaxID=883114 RepID=H3NN64_9FIRM|nr:pseudouridine synthase [Helcococcus kunzii]EHR34468.1 pseudouridine synthase [Helcococcus kunzii ATCC 51366]MCT1795467.1 rRNA pseudouridine synthase [Helcococcus kunzii]QUY64713.1 rRNA pseudouridine synthase [Helcococcus kunzii]QZO77122.1 rRNA pseudouridine synthase [Helcococcus kunzii]